MPETILVIGVAGGVGLAVTRALLRNGYAVCGSVRDSEEAAVARAAHPEIAELAILDLADPDAAAADLRNFLHSHAIEARGVVVCSGVAPFGPLETAKLASLRRTLEINAVGCVAIYQATMPMLRKCRGRLILVGSMAGKIGMPFMGHYVASKFALEGLADVMRQEAYKWGVGICLIEPGGLQTPMTQHEITGARAALERLPADERTLYGTLYAAFIRRLETSYPDCSPPDLVADAILEVLRSDPPTARREVGPDAVRLCAAARTLSDEDRDLLFRTAYQGALDRA